MLMSYYPHALRSLSTEQTVRTDVKGIKNDGKMQRHNRQYTQYMLRHTRQLTTNYEKQTEM